MTQPECIFPHALYRAQFGPDIYWINRRRDGDFYVEDDFACEVDGPFTDHYAAYEKLKAEYDTEE